VGRAVVRHVAVVGRVQQAGEPHVEGGAAGRPGAGNDEVDVHALDVHVPQATGGVVVLHADRYALAGQVVDAALERPFRAAALRGHLSAGLLAGHALVGDRVDAQDRVVGLGMAALG